MAMQEEFPQEWHEIVNAEAVRHDDVEVATKSSLKKLKATSIWSKTVEYMIYKAIQRLVHEKRHQNNRRIKNQHGGYKTTAKVRSTSTATQEVFSSLFDLYVDGRRLGSTTVGDLEAAAKQETETGRGHMVNGILCGALYAAAKKKGAKDHELIENVISETHLKRMMTSAKKKAAQLV